MSHSENSLPKGESRGEGEGAVRKQETREPCKRLANLGVGSLSLFALAITAYAALLPWLSPLLNRLGGSAASLVLLKGIIALLTLILAVLVGMQFPLANRLEFNGTATTPARLYTADFIGASLGALLTCTLLLPLIGLIGVCLLTAALNLAGAVAGRRKTATS